INTATTVVTFLMVFLIQSTQNRDTHALQIKLDELIRVVKGADTALLDLEELEEGELRRIQAAYEALAAEARKQQRAGGPGPRGGPPAARRTGGCAGGGGSALLAAPPRPEQRLELPQQGRLPRRELARGFLRGEPRRAVDLGELAALAGPRRPL